MINRLPVLALLLSVFIAQAESTISYAPQNTVFFFDLHDVVLKGDNTARFKLALKNPLTALTLAFSPVSRKGCANGEEYSLRLKKHGHKNQAELVRKISASYKVDMDVFEIIQTLKTNGYRVCMASNIGTSNLKDLLSPRHSQNKNRSTIDVKISDVIEIFDDLIFVDYESDAIVAKPNPLYFEKLQEKCGRDMHIVFVDDKKKNITAANECGLHGLRFTSAKKLEQDLQTLGII